MSKRYFTRDCKCCPFWDESRCTMRQECSTFLDLFSGGTFYGINDVLRMLLDDVRMQDSEPFQLQDGYYVDCDGIYIDKVVGSDCDVALYISRNKDIVGILMPEE